MAYENTQIADLLDTYQGMQGLDPRLVANRVAKKFERTERESEARRESGAAGALAGMTIDQTIKDFSVAKLGNPDLKLKDFLFGDPRVNAKYLTKGSNLIVSGQSEMPTFKERYAGLIQKNNPASIAATNTKGVGASKSTSMLHNLNNPIGQHLSAYQKGFQMDPAGSQAVPTGNVSEMVTNRAPYETLLETEVGNEALNNLFGSTGDVPASLTEKVGEEVTAQVGGEAIKAGVGKAGTLLDLYSTLNTLSSETSTTADKVSALGSTAASAAMTAGAVSGPVGWGLLGLSALLGLAPGRKQSKRTGKFV